MPRPRGRTIRLSPARKIIGDLVYFAKRVPSVPVQRRMPLGAVAKARSQCSKKISWCALFVKAYAIVADRFPTLRRAYLSWPTSRLFEAEENVASVAIERTVAGEPAVLFARIHQPQQKELAEIEALLHAYKNQPVESFGAFRRALLVGRFPQWLRRLLWWANLDWSGSMRVKRFGTFGVSVYAGLGAASLHPLSPLTTTLNYGPADEIGQIDVRLVYDHRVLDGADVARALAMLETVLLNDIVDELANMRPRLAATA